MTAFTRLIFALCLILPLATHVQAQTTVTTAGQDFSRAELDQMLAPIALYPDSVLSHVLIAATYPLEVVQADRWAQDHSNIDAQAAVNAVEAENWDPSVKALVAFPEVLRRMSADLNWTQSVGDAFLDDEGEVMDVIQDLRQKAYAAGTFDKMEYVRAEKDNQVIVIEPRVDRVVYVPYYDTRVVYGGWWWPDYPPVYWQYPVNHVYVGGFYWGPRVYVGSSFFFSSFHWHTRDVVVINNRRPHPVFYSSRSVAAYHGADRWRHNPVHRHGVAYRNDLIRHNYGSNRESYRAAQNERHVPQVTRQPHREDGKRVYSTGSQRPAGSSHDLGQRNSQLNTPNNQYRGDKIRPQNKEERIQQQLSQGRNYTSGAAPQAARSTDRQPQPVRELRPNVQPQQSDLPRQQPSDDSRRIYRAGTEQRAVIRAPEPRQNTMSNSRPNISQSRTPAIERNNTIRGEQRVERDARPSRGDQSGSRINRAAPNERSNNRERN